MKRTTAILALNIVSAIIITPHALSLKEENILLNNALKSPFSLPKDIKKEINNIYNISNSYEEVINFLKKSGFIKKIDKFSDPGFYYSYRSKYNTGKTYRNLEVPYNVDIYITPSNENIEILVGNPINSHFSEDIDAKSKINNAYNSIKKNKLENLINYLKESGFICIKRKGKEFDYFCDYKIPYLLKSKEGDVFILTFRRQILLGEKKSELFIEVHSSYSGL